MSATAMRLLRRHARLAAGWGFTLIEMLVVLSLIAMMLTLATPSFLTFQRNSELTAAANSFIATLSAARAEAMKRQLNTFVVPIDGSNWRNGWVAFIDVNRNVTAGSMTMDAGDTEIARHEALPSSVVVTTSADATGFDDSGVKYVMFNGSGFRTLVGGGFPSGGGNAMDVTNATESRRIIANSTGRLRVCKPADTGCSATGI